MMKFAKWNITCREKAANHRKETPLKAFMVSV